MIDPLAVAEAAAALVGLVHRTPLVATDSTSRRFGAEVRLKAENLQKVGAFKARGAAYRVSRLTGPGGVATYSSGNHGQALARAASLFDRPALVVVPLDASPAKVAAIEGYGAEVVRAGSTSDERQARCEALAAERGLTVVPPFDDPDIIAGQGTVAREILEDWPAVERIVVPVGGGGLLAGTILAAAAAGRDDLEIVAVEPEGAPTLAAALEHGQIVELRGVDTVADGLRPVRIGALNLALATSRPIRSILVGDDLILGAMRWLLERTKLLCEPSGAAGLAALVTGDLEPRPTAVVLSGGNIALDRLSELLA